MEQKSKSKKVRIAEDSPKAQNPKEEKSTRKEFSLLEKFNEPIKADFRIRRVRKYPAQSKAENLSGSETNVGGLLARSKFIPDQNNNLHADSTLKKSTFLEDQMERLDRIKGL